MLSDTAVLEMQKSKARSKVTNGYLLPGVDGRSTWMRRLRDVIHLHVSDLGGEDSISEAEKSIVRRVATLTVELERLELVFALAGEAKPEQIDLYQRTANSLRRMLVGLQRKNMRDVSPPTLDVIAERIKAAHEAKRVATAEVVAAEAAELEILEAQSASAEPEPETQNAEQNTVAPAAEYKARARWA